MDKKSRDFAKILLFEAFEEIAAYHGTSADFDRFDHEKYLSTGAGSQVFGYGTYVTNDKVIGKSYADATKRDLLPIHRPEDILDYLPPSAAREVDDETLACCFRYLNANNFDYRDALDSISLIIKQLKELMNSDPYYSEKFRYRLEEYYKIYEMLASIDYDDISKRPTVYHVEIPDDNGFNYISWYDKVTPEQMKAILMEFYNMGKDALRRIGQKDYTFRSTIEMYLTDDENAMKLIDMLSKQEDQHSFLANMMHPSGSGADVFHRLTQLFDDSPKTASSFLSGCGFTGIKYPTGTKWKRPEGADEDGLNYVIFDDNDIEIKQKEKV